MIKSGGSFFFKGMRYIAAASHIFHEARARSRVQVDSVEGIVRKFLEDYDVALIELPSGCAAVMEEAFLFNEQHSILCRVVRAGTSLHSLLFPCSDMPQPGDSGSPIQQEGRVIGLLSSVMLSNCTGTAVSSDILRRLNSG